MLNIKKIVFIIPSLDVAGAERMASQLAIYLEKNMYDITLISFFSNRTSISKRLEDCGVKIYYLDKNRGVEFKIIPKIWGILRKIKPDIVHTHLNTLIYAFIPCLLLKIPVIHTIHNVASKELPSLSSKVHKILFQKKIALPVAISPTIQDSISEYYNIPKTTIPMIYNGIELEKCIPKKMYNRECKEILHIGRFSEQKNHEMLINSVSKILKKHKNIKLILCGEGELKKSIEDEVIKMGIASQVIFRGLIDNVFQVLNEADIFVLPSLYEGFPITIIEALGTGVPIIATDVGGVGDIIKNEENGVLCKVDADDLEKKIEMCIEDFDLRQRIGMRALLTSKQFSVESMGKSYLRLYAELKRKKG